MNQAFPVLEAGGGSVDPRKYVEKGTGRAKAIGIFVGFFMFVFLCLATYGVFLVSLFLYPLFARYMQRKALALIHGSGLRVSEYQLPEINRCVATLKERLGLKKDVEVYLVESNVMNAFAVRHGRKNVVLVTDDLIHACLVTDQPKALTFILAHELAHIALGHNTVIRTFLRRYPKLQRLDEHSADAVALALVGDRLAARNGLLLLTVGHALLPFVNTDALARQAEEVAKDKFSLRAERPLSHPLPLRRLQRVMEQA